MTKAITDYLPTDLMHAQKKGWRHQLTWFDEEGRPCFLRRPEGHKEALEREADSLRSEGLQAVVQEIPTCN